MREQWGETILERTCRKCGFAGEEQRYAPSEGMRLQFTLRYRQDDDIIALRCPACGYVELESVNNRQARIDAERAAMHARWDKERANLAKPKRRWWTLWAWRRPE